MGLRREVDALKIRGLLTDRQLLVAALERETGQTAAYSGMPTFRYQVGPYTVLRDGSMEVPEAKANAAILRRLAEQGLIERLAEAPSGIAFDASGFDGRIMNNVVNALAAKEVLINRAIAVPNAFHMKADLVKELKAVSPTTMSEFMAVLNRCGGDSAIKGLWLSADQLVFTGFPETQACRMLAERIVHSAVTNRWIKAKAPKVTNDKYSFRVWLNSLGMTGPDYADTRAELLKNLSGDSCFRTPEQRAAFEANRRIKAPAPEPDFILL